MSLDICDRVNKMACQSWHCGWCHSVAHTDANSLKCHLLGEAALQRHLSLPGKIKPWQPMSTQYPQCTHLTWNKVDNTTVSEPHLRHKSHCEPLFNTLMRHTDTAAQTGRRCGRDSSLPRFQPAVTCPASHTETCTQRTQKYTGLI